MTKAQLLADLEGRDFIDWVGTPELVDTKPDGTKLYHVPIRMVTGNAATHILQPIYVVDEGGGNEAAYYKDTVPNQKPRVSALTEWMLAAIDAEPNNYKGVQVLWVSERWGMVIYSILTGTAPLVQKVYYIRKGAGGPVEISPFDVKLLGSLLKV
jgi:hypothetical protein